MHGGSSRSQDIKERNGKVELWSGKRDARRGIQGEDDWRLNHVKTPFLSRMCSETYPLDLIPNELLVTCIPSTQLATIPWLWFLYWAIICWASHVPTIGLGEVMKKIPNICCPLPTYAFQGLNSETFTLLPSGSSGLQALSTKVQGLYAVSLF